MPARELIVQDQHCGIHVEAGFRKSRWIVRQNPPSCSTGEPQTPKFYARITPGELLVP